MGLSFLLGRTRVPSALPLDLEVLQSHAWECELPLAFGIESMERTMVEPLTRYPAPVPAIYRLNHRLKAAQKLPESELPEKLPKSYSKATCRLQTGMLHQDTLKTPHSSRTASFLYTKVTHAFSHQLQNELSSSQAVPSLLENPFQRGS